MHNASGRWNNLAFSILKIQSVTDLDLVLMNSSVRFNTADHISVLWFYQIWQNKKYMLLQSTVSLALKVHTILIWTDIVSQKVYAWLPWLC